MTQITDKALVLLHMVSLKRDRVGREDCDDLRAWDELRSLGAIDGSGAMTAIGRELLGEVPK